VGSPWTHAGNKLHATAQCHRQIDLCVQLAARTSLRLMIWLIATFQSAWYVISLIWQFCEQLFYSVISLCYKRLKQEWKIIRFNPSHMFQTDFLLCSLVHLFKSEDNQQQRYYIARFYIVDITASSLVYPFQIWTNLAAVERKTVQVTRQPL
jgi:hypothetical protein